MVRGETQGRLITSLHEGLQTIRDALLKTLEHIQVPAVDPDVLQVARQAEFRFDQRKRQHCGDHRRNLFGERAVKPLEKHQRNERHDRRERAKGNWQRHFLSPQGGSLQRRHAVAEFDVNVFRRDDGVVHDDADDDDEPENAHHIRGDPEPRHQDEAACEGNRDAERDPERNARPQE